MKVAALDDALTQGRVNLLPEPRKAAYQSAVRILNENYTYVWVNRIVAALIASDRVHGLREAEVKGWYNITFKGWYQDLWIDHA